MSQAVSFQKSLATTMSELSGTKRTNVIAHVALIVMFAACLGFPLMHGYGNMGFGLAVLPAIPLALGIGIVCQVVFIPILALADFYESRILA